MTFNIEPFSADDWSKAAHRVLVVSLRVQISRLRELANWSDSQILERAAAIDSSVLSFNNTLREFSSVLAKGSFDPLFNFDQAADMLDTLKGNRKSQLEAFVASLTSILELIEESPTNELEQYFEQLRRIIDSIPDAARL